MKISLVKAASWAVTLALMVPPAAAQGGPAKDQKVARGGIYKVESNRSQISFTIQHFGFTDFSGSFSNLSGTLQMNPDKLSNAKLDIAIPIQSVSTSVPPLDAEIRGSQWFDAAQYPTAVFKSTKVTPTGTDAAIIAGDLTLHGVTKPVTLAAHLVNSAANPLTKSVTVGFEAAGTINRSDFGMNGYPSLVGDEVALKIDGAFILQ